MDLNHVTDDLDLDEASTMNWISKAIFMIEGYHHMVYLGLVFMFVFYMLMEAREKTFRISRAEELSRTFETASPVPVALAEPASKTSKICVKELSKEMEMDNVELKSVLQKLD